MGFEKGEKEREIRVATTVCHCRKESLSESFPIRFFTILTPHQSLRSIKSHPNLSPPSPIQLNHLLRRIQLNRRHRLIPTQLQEAINQPWRIILHILHDELRNIPLQHLHPRIYPPQPCLRRIQIPLREPPNPHRELVDPLAQRFRGIIIPIKPADRRASRSINLSSTKHILHRPGFIRQLGQKLLSAATRENAEAVFEEADGGIGTRETHVHLDEDFVAGAEGAAVTFADEDGFGQVLQVAGDGDVGGDGLTLPGEEGRVDALDVAVHEVEVRVGGGEDDDFGGGGGAGGGDEGLEEGEHVLEKVVVEEVEGWVVDGDAGDVAIRGEGEGAVFGGRRRGDEVAPRCRYR